MLYAEQPFFLFSAVWTAKLVWNTDYWENTAEKVSSSFFSLVLFFFPWCPIYLWPAASDSLDLSEALRVEQLCVTVSSCYQRSWA